MQVEVNGTLLSLLIISSAVWRLSYMLVWEDGPFDLLERLRELIGVRYNVHDERTVVKSAAVGRATLAKLFMCVYCMSIWLSIGWTIIFFVNSFIAVALAVPFALSTGAIVINRWCDYGES